MDTDRSEPPSSTGVSGVSRSSHSELRAFRADTLWKI